ncbi:MAG: peptide chain release factor 2 [Candidatus Pacebacteria bacterium]|nr:peptide chain release factor 2 [Candidatus Paceibacterota bacterium]
MENLLKQLEELREKIISAKKILDIASLESEKRELERQMTASGFWQNQRQAVEISTRAENLDAEISKWLNLEEEVLELEKLVALGQKEGDASMYQEAQAQLEILENKFSKLEFLLLFSEKYDRFNAILSIHAGTGGVDAQDFAQMLSRMLMRFCEKKGWQIRLVDSSPGQEAGIKSQTFQISGSFSYGYLKSENGVHRLVRISPFDAESMRHTSFAKVEVLPDLPEAKEVELQDKDLRIDVFRSSGQGGQSVNTTDSAVRIVHVSTGLSATSQSERSQHQNKETALQILKAKLYQLEEDKQSEKENKLKGEAKVAVWGKQIRSYVMQPYKMVKDHRTNFSTDQVDKVLDGEIEPFIEAYLRLQREKKSL